MAAGGLLAPLNLWAQGSPQIVWQADADSDRVNCLEFTPDGGKLITGSSDRLINIFDSGSGQVLQTLDSAAAYVHASSVEGLSINSSGSMLATVCSNYLKFWDLSSGNEHVVDVDPNWNVWVDFSPGGNAVALASFDGTIRIFDTAGNQLKVFPSDGSIQRVCVFSPNGQWLASAGGDNKITVRNTSDWSVAAVLQGHTSDIYDMRFSPDSSMLASGSYDETCRLWSTADWSLMHLFTAPEINGTYGVYAVAFSPDSQTLAYSEGENNRIRLVDTGSGNVIATYDQNTPNVQCMAFSPTTGYLAYGCADTTLYVANVGVNGNGGGGDNGGGDSNQSQLTVNVNGNGRVTPNRNEQTLVDGKKYGLTALPDADNLFVNWTDNNGNVLGTSTALKFTMQDGLSINANFTPNPFTPLVGRYEGLITSSTPSAAGSGRINFQVGPGGGFTCGFNLNGLSRSFTARFSGDGSYNGQIGQWQITLQLDISGGSDQITGTIANSSISANIRADLNVWNATKNPAPAGKYTALLTPNTGDSTTPQGYGLAIVTVGKAGGVTVVGTLADGVAFTETATLSKNNTWPLYAVVNGGAESVVGEITLENLSGSDMDGTVSWFRSANGRAAYFPNGFSTQVSFEGSAFAAPGRSQTTLSLSDTGSNNVSISIGGADAPQTTFSGVVRPSGVMVADPNSGPPRGFALTLGAGGRISGSFVDPGSNRRVTFVGAVLQKQNMAAGFFRSAGQSGYVQLAPQ